MNAICTKNGEVVPWRAGRGTRLADLRCHAHGAPLVNMDDWRLHDLTDAQRLQVLDAQATLPKPKLPPKNVCRRCRRAPWRAAIQKCPKDPLGEHDFPKSLREAAR